MHALSTWPKERPNDEWGPLDKTDDTRPAIDAIDMQLISARLNSKAAKKKEMATQGMAVSWKPLQGHWLSAGSFAKAESFAIVRDHSFVPYFGSDEDEMSHGVSFGSFHYGNGRSVSAAGQGEKAAGAVKEDATGAEEKR